MAKTKKELPKVLLNNRGNEIPIEMVRDDHLREHQTVEEIFEQVLKFQGKLANAKRALLKKFNKYKKYEAKSNKVEFEEYQNATISNYSNTKAIDFKTSNKVQFDDKIRLAQQIITDLCKSWVKDTDNNYLVVLIEEAFKADHLGLLDGKKILGLRSYKIDHPEWQKAMSIIEDSRVVGDSRSYLTLRYRNNKNDKWQTLNLNFSSIDIGEES